MADETGGTSPRRVTVPAEPAREQDGVAPRRKIRTGPLQLRAIDAPHDKPALETRLPLLILGGLGLLVAVQVFLAL